MAGGFTLAQGASSADQNRKVTAAKNGFLIFGTVFAPEGFAFPGARIHVRRAQEKKWRWEATSDARGEFAVRLPREARYEVEVSAKGFAPLTHGVDARTGNRVDLTFRLERYARGEKK